ncbi:hypothetical protein JJB74_07140 [Noviherbaspirillum sp. DKR-6]|uniref:Uncharacterized protein n=1 Tax=Noviherbaspirillum pedocola TaxID=2801341 RepID=A0A934SSD1_9BURK|nr:hypothetical protein [Noviherbaspirillum pedocola]
MSSPLCHRLLSRVTVGPWAFEPGCLFIERGTMSFPSSTSNLPPTSTNTPPSTPHARGVHPYPHVPAANQALPSVTVFSDDSRGFGLLNDASQDKDLSPEACSRAIEALSDCVELLNRSSQPDLAQDIALFTRIKVTQAEIEAALLMDADALALWRLREALQRFLPRLARDFAEPDARDAHGVDLMKFLEQEDVRTLCHGLSVCASPSAGMLFDPDARKFLRPALQQITDRLLERAVEIGFPEEVSANGTTLDILNWVSRALKHNMIKASDAIRTAFALALPLLKAWIGESRTDSASSSKAPYLRSHQLAKCAVQIDTMLNFSLIELDDEHRRTLAECVIALCEARIRTYLTKRPSDSVTITSIGNLGQGLARSRHSESCRAEAPGSAGRRHGDDELHTAHRPAVRRLPHAVERVQFSARGGGTWRAGHAWLCAVPEAMECELQRLHRYAGVAGIRESMAKRTGGVEPDQLCQMPVQGLAEARRGQ